MTDDNRVELTYQMAQSFLSMGDEDGNFIPLYPLSLQPSIPIIGLDMGTKQLQVIVLNNLGKPKEVIWSVDATVDLRERVQEAFLYF